MIQALDIAGKIAQAMGKPFERHFKVIGSSIVSCLSDQKPQVRAAGVASIDTISKMTGIDCMFSTFSVSLLPEHSILRKDLLIWMIQGLEASFGPVQDVPRKKVVDMDLLVQPLVTCLLDKTADVRNAAQGCLKFVIQSYGFEYVRTRASELFKGAQLQSITTIIDALKTAPKPTTATVQTKKVIEEVKKADFVLASNESLKNGQDSSVSKPKSRPSTVKPTTARASLESLSTTATSAPLISSDPKDKIHRSDKNIGINKWVFEAPRKDLLDFLQEQCTGHFSTELSSLLFSVDHYKEKFFLQGLVMLDDLLTNGKYCRETYGVERDTLKPRFIANADLVLKYLTIRLADTNTTMIIKCLDLIEHLFALMDEEGYTMNEYEASSFLPYFINKVNNQLTI